MYDCQWKRTSILNAKTDVADTGKNPISYTEVTFLQCNINFTMFKINTKKGIAIYLFWYHWHLPCHQQKKSVNSFVTLLLLKLMVLKTNYRHKKYTMMYLFYICFL